MASSYNDNRIVHYYQLGEIWSHAMTSGERHTEGGAQPFITPFSHRSVPGVVNNKRYCLANALTSSLWTDSTRQDIKIHRWAPPSVCLPCVYLMVPHVTRSPRPSPAAFHTGSDEMLTVGTAWERGYKKLAFGLMGCLYFCCVH